MHFSFFSPGGDESGTLAGLRETTDGVKPKVAAVPNRGQRLAEWLKIEDESQHSRDVDSGIGVF